MSRIQPSKSYDSQVDAILDGMKESMGFVPNIFRLMSNSKPSFGGFLSFSKSLESGQLSPQHKEAIALCVAGFNGCEYCTKAHSQIAKKHRVENGEIEQNLQGESHDKKTAHLLHYVLQVLKTKGHVKAEEVAAMQHLGFNDELMVEIHANIGLNIFTNYFNNTFLPKVDF